MTSVNSSIRYGSVRRRGYSEIRRGSGGGLVSSFAFLRREWPSIFDEVVRAERNGVADPRASCFYARRALELTVAWLYEADSSLQQPYRDDLAARLSEPTFRRLVGNDVRTKADMIR